MDIICSVHATGRCIKYVVAEIDENRPEVFTLTAPDVTNFNDRIMLGLSLALDRAAALLPDSVGNSTLVEVPSATVYSWLQSFECPSDRREYLDRVIRSWNKVNSKFSLIWKKRPLANKKLPVHNPEADSTSVVDFLASLE